MQRVATLESLSNGACKGILVGSLASESEALYLLKDKNDAGVSYGTLHFMHNRLVSVEKSWEVGIHNESDYANVLLDLLKRFEADGNDTCTIRTEFHEEPDTSAKVAKLICGAKRIELQIIKYKGSENLNVSEILE